MSDNREHWKPIPGFDGYDVSDWGRVRSYWRLGYGKYGGLADYPQRILKGHISAKGRYPTVNIRGKVYPIHRLVMLAFVGPCPKGLIVCHYDDNPSNNHLSNLRYDTYQSNTDDIIRLGKKIGPKGKLTREQVVEMREMAASGVNVSILIRIFGLERGTISRVCRGLAYTDAGGPIVKKMTRKPRSLENKKRAMIFAPLDKTKFAQGRLKKRQVIEGGVKVRFQVPKWLAVAVEEAATQQMMHKSDWILEAVTAHLGTSVSVGHIEEKD